MIDEIDTSITVSRQTGRVTSAPALGGPLLSDPSWGQLAP